MKILVLVAPILPRQTDSLKYQNYRKIKDARLYRIKIMILIIYIKSFISNAIEIILNFVLHLIRMINQNDIMILSG